MGISKQSFYSVDALNFIKNFDLERNINRDEYLKVKDRITEVLPPFFYHLMSENQRNRSNSGIITGDDNGNIIDYSFLIFIDLFNPFFGEYHKLKYFYKEGDNSRFDFSNTLGYISEFLNEPPIIRMIYIINYETLKLSVTFKDTIAYEATLLIVYYQFLEEEEKQKKRGKTSN